MSTFSVMCGSKACNANCPFCISKQTEACTDAPISPASDHPGRFQKAMWYVQQQGVSTAMITGRGEPTLYDEPLFLAINALDEYFPCIELQTNGIILPRLDHQRLTTAGLNTMCISVASLDDAQNRQIMDIKDKDFKIRQVIQQMVDEDYTIRISFQVNTIAVPRSPYDEFDIDARYCDSELLVDRRAIDYYKARFADIIRDAKELGAHQITFRLIGKPDASVNPDAAVWVDTHGFESNGPLLLRVMDLCGKKLATYHWGGMIYDVDGMSVCVADCLTEDPDTFEPRSWIFDGKYLRYSWQYRGAIVF